MDRCRTRGEKVDVLGIREHAWDNIRHNYYGQYTTPHQFFGEVMWDTKGQKYSLLDGERKYKYNPCTHYNWTTTCPVSTEITSNRNNYTSQGGTVWSGYDPAARAMEALGFGLGDQTVSLGEALAGSLIALKRDPFQGHASRWEAVRPTMRSKANLSVFLYELRDFTRLFDVIPAKHLYWKKTSGKKGKVTWDKVKYFNNAHLGYNFGWKPFVKDCINAFEGISSVQERLEKFVNNSERDLSKHRWYETGGSSSFEKSSLGSHFKVKFDYTYEDKWVSSFYFKYVIPKYSDAEFFARAWADTLGLHATLSNLWAVLPWSFVCDWFADVGGYLRQYDYDWITPWLNFYSAGSSVCTKFDAQISLVQLVPVAGQTFPLGSLSMEIYQRSPGLPNYKIDTGDLDADKIRLLASLVLGRLM